MGIKKKLDDIVKKINEKKMLDNYYKRYRKSAFLDLHCHSQRQYEASITRLYHTVEKGLAYLDYRPGFGKDNVNTLIESMEQYAEKYDTDQFFYQTALSVLNAYVLKNRQYGYEDKQQEEKILKLPGKANDCGGIVTFDNIDTKSLNYEELVRSRHSVRHFSTKPLDLNRVVEAVKLAQYAPSACNRQGWKTYIIQDKEKITQILCNQNGNRGFGNEFDKLLLITGDLRAFNRRRELFQVYIDGGMYAMRVLDSLYYNGIAACPLSASLTTKQEQNVKTITQMNDAEVFVLFVGIGNYPDKCQTTRSERKPADYEII